MITGKHIKLTQWVHGQLCVARVEVDAIIPDEDTSEPCFDPSVIKWLDELQRLADAGDVDELAKHGTLFVRRSA